MVRLCWLSDPHLNFLHATGASQRFGEYLCVEHTFDAVIITGDIAEADTFRTLLNEFAKGCPKPIFFLLGNHDYYRGSFAGVREELSKELEPNLTWLDSSGPILLDDCTALVGRQGWFDGRCGDPNGSRVIMSDFELIQDLRAHYQTEKYWLHYQTEGSRVDLLEFIRAVGKSEAEAARKTLLEAMKSRKEIIFATHFPPFKEACWHEGKISNKHWLPWFTCAAMGEMLAEVAQENPEHRILVLCGHTHSPGVYYHLPNLIVFTGKAVYGAPDVAGIFETPLNSVWQQRPERCDRCHTSDFRDSEMILECKLCNRVWERINWIWVLDPNS